MAPSKQESPRDRLAAFQDYLVKRKRSPKKAATLPAVYQDELIHEDSFPDDARALGLDPDLALRATTEFNREDLEAFSQVLLARLVHRESAYTKDSAATRSKKAIPLSFVDYAICCLLSVCHANDTSPPADLYALVFARFSIKGQPRKKLHSKAHRIEWAKIKIYQLLSDGTEPTVRGFAKRQGVSPSTIVRWFGRGGFEKAVAATRKQLKNTR